MPKEEAGVFSRAFKLKVVERLEAGESGTALPVELGVKRTLLLMLRVRPG